ncbi:MAG TPA: magnesium and cobalt transport protein CorA [Mycobacteriales bacterium]|nr:magnesium and cobalt transport protein CorA [Mycobacteriales bacterium]
MLPGRETARRWLARAVERGLTGGPLDVLEPRTPAARRPGEPDHLGPVELDGTVADCAVYDGGKRRGGRLTVPDARRAARTVRDGFVWLGLVEPTVQQIAAVATEFDLPPLAVEDAVKAHQRPKLERYGDVLFVVVKPVRYVDHVEIVEVDEVAVFLGETFVVTVRHGDNDVVSRVRKDLDDDSDLLGRGPSAVLYRLLDIVVDGYESVAGEIDVDVSDIEVQVFGGDQSNHSERIYKLKREVLQFRSAVQPLAPAVEELAAGAVPGVDPKTVEYFRDVHDHLLRVGDRIDGYDNLLTGVLQADLARVAVQQNQAAARQNEDVRKISAWAAIALVPTAIAGIYGMNFDNMPELHTHYGYFVVLGVILVACVGLYLQFRRRHWL